MTETAVVYIIDVPYHADKPYEYYIPGEMRESVQPGVLVEVPFGGGNRKMTAVVRSFGTSEERMGISFKPIQGVLGDSPVLSEEMLELCAFLKEYTLCTYGDAVRAAVPAPAMSKIRTLYMPDMGADEDAAARITAAAELGDKEVEVFRFLLEKKGAAVQRIRDAFGFECGKPLQKLEKAGLIRKEYKLKAQAGIVQHETVTPVLTGISAENPADKKKLKSENHRRVLAFLRLNGESDYDGIAANCGITKALARSSVKSLLEKGLVKVNAEEVYRNHFTAEHFRKMGQDESAEPITLSEEQERAYRAITALVESGLPKGALLHGVTGSGKTNVIMAAMERVLRDGRSVIMLVPEIALTPQTVGVFFRRFGDRIAVIHSALSAGERFDAWRRIREGKADVIIGTRSAVFAPVSNLGMIVIDEEHEYTYKSDTNPKYHAHDVARFRCKEHNAVMLLASATPSVSSYYKAKNGTYSLIELKNRYGKAVLPEVVICDMRGCGELVSPVLAERLVEDKREGNQAILFLNRRGYNNYVSCRTCGRSLKCPHCTVTLTYHKIRNAPRTEDEDGARNNGYLTCHMCGYRTRVPETCPECGKEHFLFMGCGTQKAEDDITEAFRDFRVIRMDLDTTQGKYSHEELLGQFRNGEADILLGTQMVTKGHDFPKVSTVGVLNADGSLMLDDYRASERTFAMLTQVIGRAGRGDVPGCAVIQTRNPDHEVLSLAAAQDYTSFYNGEIRVRKGLCFPPFCDIAVITLSSADEGHLGVVTVRMKERILEHINDDYGDVPLVVYGPFEAPVYRVQNVCRMRFVIKCRLNKRTRAFISALMCEFGKASTDRKTGKNTRITVSVDLNPTTV